MPTKSITQSWTVWAAAILALLGTAQGFDWAHLVPNNPQLVGWIGDGIAVLMFALRLKTTQPVSLTGK